MVRIISAFIAALSILTVAASAAETEYVVITDSDVNAEDLLVSVASKTNTALRGGLRSKAKVKHHIKLDDNGNDGKSSRKRRFNLVENLSDEEREALLATAGVQKIVPNSRIELAVVEPSPSDADQIVSSSSSDVSAAANEEVTSQWNLDRADQIVGRDGVYTAAPELGSNVDLYIIDTGVQGDHPAFKVSDAPNAASRVLDGKDALAGDAQPGNTDCNSHGTHVASTAAGRIYGVARAATIIPVKVLQCDGSGSLMDLSAGVSWTRSTIQARGNSRKPVVNLSIQAGGNEVIDDLIKSLHQVGAVVVVAAANFNGDACGYSPAREPVAVTVGATSPDDSKLSSSNYGRCVDVYAPGDGIIGASIFPGQTSMSKRGTSMATPLVAGVLATIRERFPSFTNQQAINHLMSISTTLGKRVNDVDCSMSLEGVQFIQTLSAKDRKASNRRKQVLVSGAQAQGEFKTWSPDLSVGVVKNEICVTFNARVAANKVGISAASVRVAVASSVLPDGVASFTETPNQCKDTTTRWYILDTYASKGGRSISSKVYDFQGNVIGDADRVPSGELSTTESRPFYVSFKLDGNGLVAELGSGNGASQRDRLPLVTGVDSNFKYALNTLTKISFSAGAQYDILYSDIRPCNDGPVEEEPTKAPTSPDSAGGGAAPPENLAVSKKNKNFFFSWPEGWSKPESAANSCFEFSVGMARGTKLFVALADQPMGRTKFNQISNGAHKHAIKIARNNIQVWRDKQLVDQTMLKPMIPIPKKKNLQVTIRTVLTPSGKMSVYIKLNQQWKTLYEFTDASAGFFGTRFSVTASMARQFKEIQVCENAP